MSNMQSLKNQGTIILLIFMGFFFLTGCTRKTTAGKEAKITIKYETIEHLPAQRQFHQELLAEFKKIHPEINVEIVYGSFEKLRIEFAGGNAPDTFYWLGSELPILVTKSQLYDLNNFFNKDKDEMNLVDFYRGTLDGCVLNGVYYAVPIQVATVTLAYNKDLFDHAGVAYPGREWTWDNFLDAAVKLTKDLDNDGRIDQYGAALPNWGNFFNVSYGIKYFNDDMTEMLFDTPRFREALQFFIDLKLKYNVVADYRRTEQWGGALAVFSSGKVAMCEMGAYALQDFVNIKKFKWDVAPIPYVAKIGRSSYNMSLGINCMWSGTKHPEESWEFLKFYASKTGIRLQGKMKNCIPVRKSITESDAFNLPPPEHISYFFDNLDKAKMLYQVNPDKMPLFAEWGDILWNEVDLLLNGKQTVEAAVNSLVAKTKEFIRQKRNR